MRQFTPYLFLLLAASFLYSCKSAKLSDAEEKLLADVGPLASAPSSIFSILSNADFPYPVVTLSDGRAAA